MERFADLHCDTLLELQGGSDVARIPHGHVDLQRLAAGRIGLQVFVAFVSSTIPGGSAYPETIALLDLLDRTIDAHPEALGRARTVDEIDAVAASGRTAAVAAIENGHSIEGDLRNLEVLANRGIRYMTLTHSRHLAWAASSGEAGDGPGGLTAFGREVVAAMNALGIVVDVSHVHESTFWDVTRVARRPFIASHSCAAAICPSPRNLTDDQLRAIGDAGGLVGINFYPGFMDPAYFANRGGSVKSLFDGYARLERETLGDPVRRNREMRRLSEAWRAQAGPAEADLDTICAHVEHVASVAGDHAVAFGSDFDGIPDLPQGVGGIDVLPAITARLSQRGWTPERLRMLAWDNVRRVLRANE